MGQGMRVARWSELLDKELEASWLKSFEWGVNDCCTFVARMVKVMTGVDYAEQFGAYSSKREAVRILNKRNIEDLATECLGEPVSPVYAERGDVLLVETEEGPALAMHTGIFAAAVSEKGVCYIPISNALKAWKVK